MVIEAVKPVLQSLVEYATWQEVAAPAGTELATASVPPARAPAASPHARYRMRLANRIVSSLTTYTSCWVSNCAVY